MEKEIKLLDYLKVIKKGKHIIFWNTTIITGLSIIISLILPKKYTSTCILLPPLPSGDVVPHVKGIAELASTRLIGLIRGTEELVAKIITSETVMDKVIEECELKQKYNVKYNQNLYGILKEMITVYVSREGLIYISLTAETPEFAKKLIDSFVKNLDFTIKNLIMSIGKKNRIFLEKRIKEVKSYLTALEDSLKRFQQKYKIVSIEEELPPFLSTIAELKSQIIEKEIQINMLKEYSKERNPLIIETKNRLNQLKKKLVQLERKGGDTHFGIGFSIPLKDVPQVTVEFLRLKRKHLIQEKVYAFLMQKYEEAKIQEVRDTPMIEMLVEPKVPIYKSFPKRKLIVGVSFCLSFMISIVVAFLVNWVQGLSEGERKEWKDTILGIIRVRRG